MDSDTNDKDREQTQKKSTENANDSDESDESPHSLPDIRNEVQPNIGSQHRQEEATQPVEKRPIFHKKRDVIKYRESGSENWKEATVELVELVKQHASFHHG